MNYNNNGVVFEKSFRPTFYPAEAYQSENSRNYQEHESSADDSWRNSRQKSSNDIEFLELTILAVFLLLYIYFCNCLKRRSIETGTLGIDTTSQGNLMERGETRRQDRSSRRTPIAQVHGRHGDLLVNIPLWHSLNNDIIDLPTVANSSRNRSDLPPSYEPCPSYEESVRNLEHWKQLGGKL